MLLATGFYSNPVPGFIFTGIVCAIATAVAVIIAVRNFGPAAKRRAASEAWKVADGSSMPAGAGTAPRA